MSFLVHGTMGLRAGPACCAAAALALAGCGGGGGASGDISAIVGSGGSTSPPTVVGMHPGASPFIAFVDLQLPKADGIGAVHYRIEPKPGAASRPVDVSYAMSYLEQRGYATKGSSSMKVPVFGLYAGHANKVDIDLTFTDGTVHAVHAEIATEAYADPNATYDHPTILKSRAAGSTLGFDYFYVRSSLGGPVVIDTDGQIRWTVSAPISSDSLFHDNSFFVGDNLPPARSLRRLELDGTAKSTALIAPGVTNIHHNIDPGKVGLLVEVDTTRNGIPNVESTLLEIDPSTAAVVKQWDLGDTLTRFMQSRGDDPTKFVRPGIDWFHMNAATYDPRDDTLLVSSRENFVIKIDYATGDLMWVLGDPSKYWHGFSSLAGSSLTVAPGGLYPIGQHALSITHDGLLLLFNNGFGSINQPAGTPAGETRSYSAVSAYSIDAALQSATEVRRFDYGQSILSLVCSSAYQAHAGPSTLISYAVADNQTHARLVGLDDSQNVVFDFQYPSSGCKTSWNAQPIPFEGMRFQPQR